MRKLFQTDMGEGGEPLTDARLEPETIEFGSDIQPYEEQHGTTPPDHSPAIRAGENPDSGGRNPKKTAYRRVIHSGQISGGATTDTKELDRPREGYAWFIERIVVRSTGAGNITLFDTNPTGTENTLWFSGALVANTPVQDSPSYPLHVPENRPLFAVISGGAAGDVYSVRLQVREEEIIR